MNPFAFGLGSDFFSSIRCPLILDGAFGTLLGQLGWNLEKDDLWSGGALISAPQLVAKAHRMFIDAGADIIETNSYHVSIQKLMESRGFSLEQAESILHKSVLIAREAIAASGRPVALVGAVGPYATYLRDASEYTGAYVKKPDFQEQTIIDYYLLQCRPLIAAGVTTLNFETIPSVKEVECVAKVMDQLDDTVQAWVCCSCQDGKRTRSGDAFADAVKIANGHPKIVAIGINCTAPDHITELLTEAKKANNSKPLVVYPNSGEVYNAETRKFEGDAKIDSIVAAVPQWFALGARVFGGCCRITPSHISQIAATCRTLRNGEKEKYSTNPQNIQ
ncbi:hypothetical protein niasHT_019765 [Heterodera trifolii]|uniref:Hcy-binding domain-containing protein n=1 Tax=Heterodera trifolii TaxID=157864 RepID=A0ABD2LC63_9BILA